MGKRLENMTPEERAQFVKDVSRAYNKRMQPRMPGGTTFASPGVGVVIGVIVIALIVLAVLRW